MEQRHVTEQFRQALEANPDEVGAFRALQAAYRQEGRWVDLCRLYERQAEQLRSEPVLGIQWLLAAGDLWLDRTGDAGRAAECYRRVLELEPHNRVAYDALEETYRAANRFRDLLDLLLLRGQREEEVHRRGELWLKVAELLERELHRPEEAVAYFEEALRANPFLREAVREGMARVLERRPREPAALASLERIYRELGDQSMPVELLRRRAEVAEDAQDRADLYCDLALLLQERRAALDAVLEAYRAAVQAAPLQPGRIVDGLREILRTNPGCRPAMVILRRVYAGLHRWNEVLDLLEEEVGLARGAEAGELFFEMGLVEEERLFRPDRAAAHYRETARRAGTLAPRVLERLRSLIDRNAGGAAAAIARRLLAEVLAESEAWPKLEALLLEGRVQAGNQRERLECATGAARIRLERLGDPAGAADLLLEVLHEDPRHEEALRGLEAVLASAPGDARVQAALAGLYRQREAWAELVRLLEQQLTFTREPQAQAALHFELGTLWEEKLDRREQAMAHFQNAFRLHPEEPRYIEAGSRIYRQLRRWPMVVRLHDLELSSTRDPVRRQQLLLEKARIFRRQLRQPVEACVALLEVLETDPGLEEAHREVRGLLAVAEDRQAVVAALEALGQQDEQLHFAASRLALLARLMCEEPADLEQALELLLRAQRLEPEDPALLPQLEAVLQQLRRWPDLMELYLRAAARELDEQQERHLRLKAAHLLLHQLGDASRAARIFRQVLELDPGNRQLREELKKLLLEHRQWAELTELYRWMLANAPDLAGPAYSQQVLLEWAELAATRMEDSSAAAEPYSLLLTQLPNHPAALDFFRQFYAEGRQWSELRILLDRAWSVAPDAGASLLAEAARITEEQLGDPEGAVERWETLLRRQPGHRPAREALERLYARLQRWEPLVGVLVGQAEATGDAPGRVELLRRAVEVARESAGDLDRAEQLLQELLRVAPNDSSALETLGEVFETRGRWEALADNLGRRAGLSREMVRRAELLRRRALLLSQRLNAHDLALRDLEQVLDLFPEDRPALELTRTILASQGRVEELLRVMDRQVALALSPEAKLNLLREMATLAHERNVQPALTVSLWQRILGFRPLDREALTALSRLHEQQEDWTSLIAVLQRLTEIAQDSGARGNLLSRQAQVWQDRLHDPEHAQQAWQQVLEIDPDDGEAIARLQALFDQQQDWTRLAEVLERRIRLEPDPAEAATLLKRRAEILEVQLGRPRPAIQALEEARERVPGDPETLRPLRRLLIAQGEFRRAVGTIEEELAQGTSPQGVELGLQAAELWRNHIKEPQGAIAWYERVLQLDPDQPDALIALRTLYRRKGDLEALERVVETLLRLAREADERVALLMELGEIARDVGDPERAFLRFRQAHQLAPEDTEQSPLHAIRRLAESHGLWERLIEVLQWSMQQTEEVTDRLQFLSQIAQIQEVNLRDAGRALATVRFAFTLTPEEGPILAELERLSRLAGQWQTYLEAFDLLIRSRKKPQDRLELLLRRARVLEVECHEVAAAFAELRTAFQLDPGEERVRREIEQLAERSGEWNPVLEVYGTLLEQVENLRAQVLLLQRMATILEEKRHDPSAAFEALVRAFGLDPLNSQVELELNRLGAALGRWTTLVTTYEQQLDRIGESRVQARFLVRLAEIEERALGQPERAFLRHQAAFRVDPRNEHSAAELARLAQQVPDGWPALLRLFTELAERVQPVEIELALRRRCIRIIEEELKEPASITPHLLRLWQLEEANEDEVRRLTARLREEGGWDLLLRVHQAILARTVDPARRLVRLFQVAQLQEQRFNDLRGTLATLQTILQEAPGNLEALRAMARIYAALGNEEQALATLEEEAAHQEDPAAAALLGQRIAARWDALGRPDLAARRLKRILADDPDHAGATGDLEALYTREGNWEDLLELLERLTERARTREQRLDCLNRMAQLAWERFDNRKRAVRCLTRILEEEPGHVPALERMAAFFREERRWGDLVDILERLVLQGAEPGGLLRLLLEIGEVQEQQLFSRKRAVEAYERALQLAPRDERVLAPLDRLYEELEDWPSCNRIRRLRAQAAAGTPLYGARLLAQAQIELVQLHLLETSAQTLKAALEADPTRRSELTGWREQAMARKDRHTLLVLLGVEEATASSAEERAALLCEMGRLAEKVGERATALDRYRRALEVRPGHLPALAALTSLHRAAGEWREMDLYLGRTIRLLSGGGELGSSASLPALPGATPPPPPPNTGGTLPVVTSSSPTSPPTPVAGLADHYLDWARVALLLRERGMAISRLNRALEIDPAYRPARRILADLYFEDGRWELAETCYRRLLETRTEMPRDPEAATHSYRLGRCLEASGRPAEAVVWYRQTLELDGDHPEAYEHLLPCLRRNGEWEELARVLDRLLSRTQAPDRRYELLVELGVLLEEQLKRREAAISRLEEAHRVDPGEPRALRRLLAILRGSTDHTRIITLAGELAQLTGEPQEARELRLLQGQLLYEQLHRPDAAAEAFRRVLEVNPRDSDAMKGLIRALEAHGEWGEQARLLQEHVALLDAAGETVPVAILLNLAQLHGDRLGQPEEAGRVLERALQAHPTSAEVRRAWAVRLAAQAGREQEVVGEIERAIELDPANLQAQHQLFQALLRAGEKGRASAQGEILAFLQLITPEEAALRAQLRPGGGSFEVQFFPQELLLGELMTEPQLGGVVPQLLDALLAAAPGLFFRDREALGLRPAERLEPASQHSLALRFMEVQEALGLTARELYLRAGSGRPLEVAPTDPPCLAVGDALVRGLFRREQRFHLGRGLALTLRPMFLARSLGPADGESLLAGLSRLTEAESPGAHPPSRWTGLLQTALADQPARRQELVELARQTSDGSFMTWQRAVERWACRVGTVLAGDLGVALKALRAELSGDRRRALREMEGLQDLLRRSSLARDLLSWIRSARYPQLLEALEQAGGSRRHPALERRGAAPPPPRKVSVEELRPRSTGTQPRLTRTRPGEVPAPTPPLPRPIPATGLPAARPALPQEPAARTATPRPPSSPPARMAVRVNEAAPLLRVDEDGRIVPSPRPMSALRGTRNEERGARNEERGGARSEERGTRNEEETLGRMSPLASDLVAQPRTPPSLPAEEEVTEELAPPVALVAEVTELGPRAAQAAEPVPSPPPLPPEVDVIEELVPMAAVLEEATEPVLPYEEATESVPVPPPLPAEEEVTAEQLPVATLLEATEAAAVLPESVPVPPLPVEVDVIEELVPRAAFVEEATEPVLVPPPLPAEEEVTAEQLLVATLREATEAAAVLPESVPVPPPLPESVPVPPPLPLEVTEELVSVAVLVEEPPAPLSLPTEATTVPETPAAVVDWLPRTAKQPADAELSHLLDDVADLLELPPEPLAPPPKKKPARRRTTKKKS